MPESIRAQNRVLNRIVARFLPGLMKQFAPNRRFASKLNLGEEEA
ncbi:MULTISPECIES: hypothetical protein [unclassified Mesorhizobium]|nr:MULTISPECIES: hypothetical protein [unclassified Mesorhizobium]